MKQKFKRLIPFGIAALVTLVCFFFQSAPRDVTLEFYIPETDEQRSSESLSSFMLHIQPKDLPEKIPVNVNVLTYTATRSMTFTLDPYLVNNQGMTLSSGSGALLPKQLGLKVYDKGGQLLLWLNEDQLAPMMQRKGSHYVFDAALSQKITHLATKHGMFTFYVALISFFLAWFWVHYAASPFRLRFGVSLLSMFALFFILNDQKVYTGFQHELVYGQPSLTELAPKEQFDQTFWVPEGKKVGQIQIRVKTGAVPKDKPVLWAAVKDRQTGEVLAERWFLGRQFSDEVRLNMHEDHPLVAGTAYQLELVNIGPQDTELFVETYPKKAPLIGSSSAALRSLGMTLRFQLISLRWVGLMLLMVITLSYLLILGRLGIRNVQRQIIVIYALALSLFAFASWIQSERTKALWDPNAHLSFIVSLATNETTGVPEYQDHWLSSDDQGAKGKQRQQDGSLGGTYRLNPDFINYQGHPPLYHQLLRYLGRVQANNPYEAEVSYTRLVMISQIFAIITVLLWFLLGMRLLPQDPLYHWVYSLSIACYGLLIYGASQLSNDILPLASLACVLHGLITLARHKYPFWSYALIAFGLSTAVLIKVNVGVVAILVALIFLIRRLSQKDYEVIQAPGFWWALPIYIVPLVYYITMYQRYGSFMVTYIDYDPEGFYESFAYVPFGVRSATISLGQFMVWFYYKLMHSVVEDKLPGYGLAIQSVRLIYQTLFLSFFLWPFWRKRSVDEITATLRSVATASWLFLIELWINTYMRYYYDGYLGGVQSRYFLYGVPVMSLALVYQWGQRSQGIVLEEGYRQLRFADDVRFGLGCLFIWGWFWPMLISSYTIAL